MRPSLFSADECTAVHVWAQSSLPGCVFFFFFVEQGLHVHRCQSCQQSERQIKQTTGGCRVHSTSYDKGSCFTMA